MYKFLVLVALAAVASAAVLPQGILRFPSGRIIGGENTTIEEAPYQVSLRAYGRHICGGSIINKYWVLTAGHCVGGSVYMYTIRAGSSYHAIGGSQHTVAQIVQHEDYRIIGGGIPVNDIALIRVNEAFEFDETRQEIPLFDEAEETPAGSVSIITGWGSTAFGSPSVLQTVKVPIITKESCHELYDFLGGLPEGQICAAYAEGGKDACKGDSGGPLAVDGRLAGVVSWGYGCAEAGNPGVYTEVAFFRSWIKLNSGI